jgi:hypothetical protein
MQDKSTISIFQGSTVEADTVHDFLAQQGIGSLVRNHMQESLDAGWVTADPEHAAEVFVDLHDETRAVELLRNLFSQDTAVPATGTTAAGNAIIIESERAAAQPDAAQPGVAPRPDITRQETSRPLDLPRMISLPNPDNRPPMGAPAPVNRPSEAPASNTGNRPTPPPAAPPRL